MEVYKCIESFEIAHFQNGKIIGGFHKVVKGSIWEYAHDYTSNSDCRLYLKDGDSDFEFIDITYNRFEKCFQRIA